MTKLKSVWHILCHRNFPQGTIGDMVRDASQGISFVCNNVAIYGGDPKQYVTSYPFLF